MNEPLNDYMIDERYWLSLSKVMLDSAITRREEAAAKLVTGVGWFWTVYSTVVLTTLAVTRRTSLVMAVALLVPAAALVAAYLAGLKVLQPLDQQIILNSPTEIQKRYDEAVRKKCHDLAVARRLTSLSGVAIVASILVVALSPGTGI